MNFKTSANYPATLSHLLNEDFALSVKPTLDLLLRRYEAWIIFLISRGNLQDIEKLAQDLALVYQIEYSEILKVFRKCKSEISIKVELGVEFNDHFKPFITAEYLNTKVQKIDFLERVGDRKCFDGEKLDFDMRIPKNYESSVSQNDSFFEGQKKTPESGESNSQVFLLEDFASMNSCLETGRIGLESRKTPMNDEAFLESIDKNLEQDEELGTSHFKLEYFFLSSDPQTSQEREKLDYSSLPKINPALISSCSDQTCSNQTFCSCSEYTNSQIGVQRTLIVHKGLKRIPRTWKDEFYLFECQSSCNCNKSLCSLTFFSPSQKNLTRAILKDGQYRTSKDLTRGEFVLEVFGKLAGCAFEKGIQLAEGIFMNLEKSNLKKILDDKPGNLVPVRIFSFVDQRVICRLALFTSQMISKGDVVSLDFSRLEKFMDNSGDNS